MVFPRWCLASCKRIHFRDICSSSVTGGVTARARARGYRNVHNFITVIYLIAGKLDLRFAHTK